MNSSCTIFVHFWVARQYVSVVMFVLYNKSLLDVMQSIGRGEPE